MRYLTGWLLCCFAFLTMTSGFAAEGVKPSANAKRSELPADYTWDLGSLFDDAKQWQAAFDQLSGKLATIQLCKGKMGKNAQETLACLTNLYTLKNRLDELLAFAFQTWSVAMTEQLPQEIKEKAVGLSAKLTEIASFVDPELREISGKKWDKLVEKDAELAQYEFHYKDLKRREKHLLPPEQEALLALTLPMQEGPYNIMQAMTQEMDFPTIKDESGQEVMVNFATFPKYRGSKNRDVRKQAVNGFFSTLFRYRNTLASSLATSVKGAVFHARARGYSSSLEMSLDVDNVPVAVYETLLKTTGEKLPQTLHRYVAFRKKVLGIKEIHYYDMYNPLFPKMSREYDYDQALELMSTALKPMGDDYLAVLSAGMKPGSGWSDVYPHKGKKGGAYCNAAYGTHPFVFLNFMNELDDVFTTAHEFGHAMHFYLASEAQPYPTADSTIFLAEIASTFHEEMLLNYLLKNTKSDEEKIVLLNKRLENIRLTITRQTMFAEFEKLLHSEVESGGAITAERLNTIYKELLTKYFGPEFSIDDGDVIEWAYIPHFYYNFYVYKYSTGLMSSIVFTDRVLKAKPGALRQYQGLLRAGGSDYPLTILNKAGIDFTDSAIVASTYDLFSATLDEMEKLL